MGRRDSQERSLGLVVRYTIARKGGGDMETELQPRTIQGSLDAWSLDGGKLGSGGDGGNRPREWGVSTLLQCCPEVFVFVTSNPGSIAPFSDNNPILENMRSGWVIVEAVIDGGFEGHFGDDKVHARWPICE